MKPTYEKLEQQLAESQSKLEKMAAENIYLINGAARELNTAWMFHKTMLGAQAALVCIVRGDIKAARDWLEGTTDEAGADIPDEITVAELQEWFDSQMVSNDGKSGFLTRGEAEEAIKAKSPATDDFLAEVRAQGVDLVCDYHRTRCEALYDVDRNGSQRHGAALCDAIDIAAQLRQGAAS